MGHRREAGRILPNTYLVDGLCFGIRQLTALYVVKGRRSALIDSGTHRGAPGVVEALKAMGLFPVDRIILTHEHSDHTQGAMPLARAMGPDTTIYASRKAKPVIEDPAGAGYAPGGRAVRPVENVIPLDEGDTVDLGGVELEVIAVPGHSPGHIALYDRAGRNIFLGDSVADKIDPAMLLPCHSPPWFDREEFLRTLARLQGIEFDTACLAHYGCWDGADARNLLADASQAFEDFWGFFQANKERLDDTGYLASSLTQRYLPAASPDMAHVAGLIISELRDGFREYCRRR